MNRRDFLESSGIGILAVTLAELGPSIGAASQAQERVVAAPPGDTGHDPTTYRLTEKLDAQRVRAAYLPGALGLGGVPYVYAFYDEQARKFASPLDVKPGLDKGSYTLQPVLHAFNISQSDQTKVRLSKGQVQLGFNVTAPITPVDQLTWIFMNAVDVFLARDAQGRQSQLTKFGGDNGKNGAPLDSAPKVTVTNGIVSLQVTAFGHHQDSLMVRVFDAVSSALKSPIASAALKGFGIPALAADAVAFVDHALDVVARQNSLIPLWQSGSLEFAVTKDAPGRFRMTPGLWVIMDADYARSTDFLDGHSVDLRYQSFRVNDKAGKPVDANYLVADMKFSSGATVASPVAGH